jgi:hypothetical protein
VKLTPISDPHVNTHYRERILAKILIDIISIDLVCL